MSITCYFVMEYGGCCLPFAFRLANTKLFLFLCCQRTKKNEFCYGVYNQYESFIYLDLIVKNRKIAIKRYFKWWTSIKLV
jgi:hypothetical protein